MLSVLDCADLGSSFSRDFGCAFWDFGTLALAPALPRAGRKPGHMVENLSRLFWQGHQLRRQLAKPTAACSCQFGAKTSPEPQGPTPPGFSQLPGPTKKCPTRRVGALLLSLVPDEVSHPIPYLSDSLQTQYQMDLSLPATQEPVFPSVLRDGSPRRFLIADGAASVFPVASHAP